MNDHYDQDDARRKLEAIYEELAKFKNPNTPQLTDVKVNDIRFEAVEYPPSLRIMVKDDDGEHAEVVMKMQGVLCASTLPPFRRPPSTKSLGNVRNLRQYVKITSFGSPSFEEACIQIESIRKQLQAQLTDETVLPINFLPYEGSRAIEAHARYFTDRNLVPLERNQSFNPHVDPFNILANLKPDVFIHGPDNKVDYLNRTTDKNGCIRHIPIDPNQLRAGDIVEIAFSCVAVPVKDKRRMMFLSLRALTLLDDSARKDSENKNRLAAPPATPQKITTFKRRQPYIDLDYGGEDIAHVKRARLDEQSEGEELDGRRVEEQRSLLSKVERNFSGLNVEGVGSNAEESRMMNVDQ